LRGEDLAAFDREPEFASFVLNAAGLALELNRSQTWNLGELKISVEPWLDRRGFYLLAVEKGWPSNVRRKDGHGPESIAMAEVFATCWSGEPLLPSGPESARWKLRALLEAGLVDRPAVSIAELRDDAPQVAILAWEGIRELVAVRSLTQPAGEPVPLSSLFLARWCPLEESAVRRGKRWLERFGFIVRAGEAEFGCPKRCILWNVACGNGTPYRQRSTR
jgi:hypothetical protein